MSSQPAHAAPADDTAGSFTAELYARLLLTLGTLLGYFPLLGFDKLIVTDDAFMSDVWNGELPVRVSAARMLHEHGQLPTWFGDVCSGAPALGVEEPMSLSAFSALPTGAALCALLLARVLVAAHGTYWLARRAGAARTGAVLAGLAFGMSGYIVTQLKHLSVIGVVVWLPVGLALLDSALGAQGTRARRALHLCLFGCVFAEQLLSSFPQSAYYCGLVYGAFALVRVLHDARPLAQHLTSRVLLPLTAAGIVVAIAGAAGAISLLPLAALGDVSDRGAGNTWQWATQINYDPRDIVMFVAPYANGDVSDATYRSNAIFWEDYGYVGLATLLLALYACVRERKSMHARFLTITGVVAFLLVLGPATPLFRIAFDWMPGFKLFRFPTRALVVVDLCLCVLAALGLTRLTSDLTPLAEPRGLGRVLRMVLLAIVMATELDLLANQMPQNPIVKADQWLAPPPTAKALQNERGPVRVFTPFHMDLHHAAFVIAHGWSDLRPFYALRDLIQPNTNLFWNLAAADCYSGISARWYVDVWGDHNRGSLVVYPTLRPRIRDHRVDARPAFAALMRTYGVTHVLSPLDIPALGDPWLVTNDVRIYRIAGAERVRVVEHAVVAKDTAQAVAQVSSDAFDPDALVVLSDAPASLATPPGPLLPPEDGASAKLEREGESSMRIRAHAPSGGFLVVSDTFFPDWSARVDGQPAPIYRANVSVRAIPLTRGEHVVELEYHPHARARAIGISLAGWALLLLGVMVSGAQVYAARASRRSRK